MKRSSSKLPSRASKSLVRHPKDDETNAAGDLPAAGEKGMIRRIAYFAAEVLGDAAKRETEDRKQAALQMAFVLTAIANGEASPDEAFRWRPGKHPKADHETIWRQNQLTGSVKWLAAKIRNKAPEDANSFVQNLWPEVSLFDQKEAWGSIIIKGKKTVSLDEAKQIAAALTAAKHIANKPHWSAWAFDSDNFKPLTASTLLARLKHKKR